MSKLPTRPYRHPRPLSDEERLTAARAFRELMSGRRTVRDFSSRPVGTEVLLECIAAAGSAPSGAHRQPWHFVVVHDAALRRQIREAAEKEEEAFYSGRAPDDWLEALAPIGTDANKPFLEEAGGIIVIFAERYGVAEDGSRQKNYYVQESVGIATGILITALHSSGLATLTHTPSPMGFLGDLLERPRNEQAFLILVVGHPAPDARVPDFDRKSIDAIATVK